VAKPAIVKIMVAESERGDTLFMPDVGTARTDFPGGSAAALYQSVRALLGLPARTRLFHCHDYPPAGRDPQWESSVAQQCAHNIHIRDGVSRAQFVTARESRDATLAPSKLILPALQVNILAGALPPAEANGVAYLKIPVNMPQPSSPQPLAAPYTPSQQHKWTCDAIAQGVVIIARSSRRTLCFRLLAWRPLPQTQSAARAQTRRPPQPSPQPLRLVEFIAQQLCVLVFIIH